MKLLLAVVRCPIYIYLFVVMYSVLSTCSASEASGIDSSTSSSATPDSSSGVIGAGASSPSLPSALGLL